jgi:hypothetical protein
VAVEGARVARFVWQTLKNDAGVGGVNTLLGGRIYRDRLPQAVALPAATVTLVSSTDTVTQGGARVFSNALVDVRVVGNGVDYGALLPAADRADAVLNTTRGQSADSVGTFFVNKLRREQTQMYVEDQAGVAYSHVLQTYRSEAYL